MSMLMIPPLAVMAAAAASAQVPNRIELTYEVSWNGMKIGKSTEKFEHDSRQFKIVSDTATTGLAAMLRKVSIHVESSGSIVKGLLQPLSYSEERTKKPRRSAAFDWTKRQIILNSGQGPQVLALPDHPVFDRASFGWSFAFSPPTAREGKIGMTDGRKLSEYRYAVLGSEMITTPAGSFEALRVRKIQEDGDTRGFEVWLAIRKHHLPVRVMFKDDDDTVDSIVSKLVFPTNP